MISLKPKLTDPQGKLFSVFNVSNFYSDNEYVIVSQLMEYSNLYSKNIFYYINSFMNGLTFEVSEISNISYDESNNSTNITGNTWFENSSVNMNLNIGNQLNVTNILSQNLTTNVISVNDLNCRNLKLNNRVFNEVVGYFLVLN